MFCQRDTVVTAQHEVTPGASQPIEYVSQGAIFLQITFS